MRLQPGATLGRYEVIARIGGGGMGEVYLARDTHLDKTVALKTIATGFAQDPMSLPRFERERRIAASLEHPHICRLLDAGHEQGLDYLAMEFLEGETLAARVQRGPLPIPLALGYAIEIAGALQYAHRRGVIHRDLKPGNVFLTSTGAKVLDFGLAKLHHADPARAAPSGDTAPAAATAAGTLVGSAPYMAPERLEGRDADERTDVFAFGLVLYEMFTGRRAFDGGSAAALIASILSSDPAPMGLSGPQADDIEWVVRKCLAKGPTDRWQAIGDVEVVLKRIAGHGMSASSAKRWGPMVAAGVLALLALIALAVVGLTLTNAGTGSSRTMTAFAVPPPPGGTFTPTEGSIRTAQLALSHDGKALAFVAAGADGISQIWIRRFDALVPAPVPGTAEASYPFWSPDGKSLGFFAPGLLRRVDLGGGPARTIAAAPNGRGGTWNRDGVILFSANTADVIYRVPATGGTVTPQTRIDPARGDTSHRWPQFLPDGRRFLYFSRSDEADEGVYLGSLDGTSATLLVNSPYGGVFLPPHWVLFISDETLLARALDLDEGRATGDPVPLAERVGGSSNFYAAVSVAAETGTIAYGSPAITSDVVWFDRRGQRVGTVSSAGHHVDFDLSPDGRALALASGDETSRSDIYVFDVVRGTRTRLTSSRATDASPVWAPDRQRLIFRSNRERVHDLYIRDAGGTAPERPFFRSGLAKYPTQWSRDGRLIVFHRRDVTTGWDVFAVATDGSESPRPLVQSQFNEMQGQLSPDGQWLAYTSEESVRPEVYAQSLTPDGPRVQISVNGGSDPKWRADGTEIYFISPDGHLSVVAFKSHGATAEPAPPQPLFRMPVAMVRPPYPSHYDLTPDGERFLVTVPTENIRSLPLTVVLNALSSTTPSSSVR